MLELSSTSDFKYDGLEFEIKGGTVADLQDYVEGFTSFMVLDWDYVKVITSFTRYNNIVITFYLNGCLKTAMYVPGIIGPDIDFEDLTFYNVEDF